MSFKDTINEKDLDLKGTSSVDHLSQKKIQDIVDGLLKKAKTPEKAIKLLNNICGQNQILNDSLLDLIMESTKEDLFEEKNKDLEGVITDPVQVLETLLKYNLPPALIDSSHGNRMMVFLGDKDYVPYVLKGYIKQEESLLLSGTPNQPAVDVFFFSKVRANGYDSYRNYKQVTAEELTNYIESCKKNPNSIGGRFLSYAEHYYNNAAESKQKIDDMKLLRKLLIQKCDETLKNKIITSLYEKYQDQGVFENDINTILEAMKTLEGQQIQEHGNVNEVYIDIKTIKESLNFDNEQIIDFIVDKLVEAGYVSYNKKKGYSLSWLERVVREANTTYSTYYNDNNLSSLLKQLDIPTDTKIQRTNVMGKQYWEQLIRVSGKNTTTFVAKRFMPYNKKIKDKLVDDNIDEPSKQEWVMRLLAFYETYAQDLKELYYMQKEGTNNEAFIQFLQNSFVDFKTPQECLKDITIFSNIWSYYKALVGDNFEYIAKEDIFHTINNEKFIFDNFADFLYDPECFDQREKVFTITDSMTVDKDKTNGELRFNYNTLSGQERTAKLTSGEYDNLKDNVVAHSFVVATHAHQISHSFVELIDSLLVFFGKYREERQTLERCAILCFTYLNSHNFSGQQMVDEMLNESEEQDLWKNETYKSFCMDYMLELDPELKQICESLIDGNNRLLIKDAFKTIFDTWIENNPVIDYQDAPYQLVKYATMDNRFFVLRLVNEQLGNNTGISFVHDRLRYVIENKPFVDNTMFFQTPGNVKQLRTLNAKLDKENVISKVVQVKKTIELRGILNCIDKKLLTYSHVPLVDYLGKTPILLGNSMEKLYKIESLEYDSGFVQFRKEEYVLENTQQYTLVNVDNKTPEEIKDHIRIKFSVFSRTTDSNATTRGKRNYTVVLPLSEVEKINSEHGISMSDDSVEFYSFVGSSSKDSYDMLLEKLKWLEKNNFFADNVMDISDNKLRTLRHQIPDPMLNMMKAYYDKLMEINKTVSTGKAGKTLFAPDDNKSEFRGMVGLKHKLSKQFNAINQRFGMMN